MNKNATPSNGRVKTGTAERGGGGGSKNLAAIALKKSL